MGSKSTKPVKLETDKKGSTTKLPSPPTVKCEFINEIQDIRHSRESVYSEFGGLPKT